MDAEGLRALLFVFIAAMYAAAMTFLLGRRLTAAACGGWGLFALVIPVLGPFLVIALRPGRSRVRAAIGPTSV